MRSSFEPDKVIIFGLNGWYTKYLHNHIKYWESKQDIQLLAYVVEEKSIFSKYDSHDVIQIEQLETMEYDYIIIASDDFKKEMEHLSEQYGISQDCLIDGKVFLIQFFDWKRYISIKKKEISIIADSCFGGLTYDYLSLRFHSPFINTRVNQYSYLKLLENLDYYLAQPLKLEKDIPDINDLEFQIFPDGIDWGFAGFPVYLLDDIRIYAVHEYHSIDFENKWKKRMKRFHPDQLFVMMVIENDDIAYRFSKLNIKNKIGFYYKELNLPGVLCLKEYQDMNLRYQYNYNFRRYIHNIFYSELTPKTIDMFKMLNGEDDFYMI